MLTCPDPSSFRIISHRCMGFGERANSLAALNAALNSSVDEVELDFRATKDGQLVASHFDLYLDRLGLPRLVSRCTLVENQSHGLMSLEECLALFANKGGDKKLRLEIKSVGVERGVMDAVKRVGLLERTVVVSWSLAALHAFRSLEPNLELSLSFVMGLQGKGKIPFAWPTSIPAAVNDINVGVKSVNIIAGVVAPSPGYIASLKGCGLEVFLLSAGGAKNLERLQRYGATGGLFSSVDGLWSANETNKAQEV